MSVLALDFPPVSHLVEWGDLLFDGTIFGLNKVAVIFLLATMITILLFAIGGRKRLVPTGTQNLLEVGVEFIEDSIIMQTIGSDGMRFLPFLTTMFFFIFFTNLFEVIPFIQFPGNARMAIPITLALLVWFIYNYLGVRHHGFFGYLKNSLFPPGVPKPLLPLVALIEFVSVFLVRPFSLAVRLFANMLAGHLLLVTFAVLTAAMFVKAPLIIFLPVSFAVLVALTAFEVLVALLQAFIFTILTAVYIGSSLHPEH